MMAVHLVYFVTMLLNDVPAAKGISEKAPHLRLSDRDRSMQRNCSTMFGANVEARTDADVTNDMTMRTH